MVRFYRSNMMFIDYVKNRTGKTLFIRRVFD